MKIEIFDTEVKERTVRSKKDGKEYTFYTQEGFYHDGTSPYPTRCNIPVSSLSAAYRPGVYRVADNSVYVDRFGNLGLQRRFALVED